MTGGEGSCVDQAIPAVGAGVATGVFVGAAASAWKETDLPKRALPMIQSTGGLVARYSFLFATVGGLYVSSKCVIEDFRKEKDFMNGFLAGCLAGAAVGIKSGKPSTIVGSCAALGVTGAILDRYNYNIFGTPAQIPGFRQDWEKVKAANTQKEMNEE